MLGEAKFYKTKLDKKYIREYIGVLKDIQENYFVSDDDDFNNIYPRRMEIGVYFAANGFQAEAEKLAYAHGIKTISYKNNPIINDIKQIIEEIESNFLSVKCMNNGMWSITKSTIKSVISGNEPLNIRDLSNVTSDGFQTILLHLSEHINAIQTSFIGSTATGVFIHFVSQSRFPSEIFNNTDEAYCRVFYNFDNFQNKYFWLEISEDNQRSRFYFTPPDSLNEASLYGRNIVLGEKERLFRSLNVSITINGVVRNLILHIDRDWLNAIRNDGTLL